MKLTRNLERHTFHFHKVICLTWCRFRQPLNFHRKKQSHITRYILGASIAPASKFLGVQGSVFLSVSPTGPNGLIPPPRHQRGHLRWYFMLIDILIRIRRRFDLFWTLQILLWKASSASSCGVGSGEVVPHLLSAQEQPIVISDISDIILQWGHPWLDVMLNLNF